MSERLREYLEEQSEGESSEQGTFTLNPVALRSKMLASVPPVENGTGQALCHLRSALRLAGLRPDPAGSFPEVSWKHNRYYPRLYEGPISANSPLTPELVERVFREPFRSEDPLELSLSRGLLWVESLQARICWEWRSPRGGTRLETETEGRSTRRQMPKARYSMLRVLVFQDNFRSGQVNWLAPKEELLRGWGRETPFLTAPDRQLHAQPRPRWEFMKIHNVLPHFYAAGYFEYRVPRVALADKLLPIRSGQVLRHPLKAEPIVESFSDKFALFCVGDHGYVPIVMRLSPRLEPGDYQAAITLRLTDGPTILHLGDWGPLVPVHNKLPPGFLITAVWPGLQTDTWGETLVANAALDEAMAWITEEVDLFLEQLRERSAELIEWVNRRCSSSYREEVLTRMRALRWILA